MDTLRAKGQTNHLNSFKRERSLQNDFKTLQVVIYPSCCIDSMLLQVYAMQRVCVCFYFYSWCHFLWVSLFKFAFSSIFIQTIRTHTRTAHICATCPLTNYLEAFKKSLSKQFCQFLKSYARIHSHRYGFPFLFIQVNLCMHRLLVSFSFVCVFVSFVIVVCQT